MPFGPPERGSRFQLGACRVANPVSSYHGARMVNDLAYLLAANAVTIADCSFDTSYGGGSADVSVLYARSPGAYALLVGVELAEADAAAATITVTNNGSALTWLEHNGLDGSLAIPTPPASTHLPQLHHGVVDVSGLATNGTIYRLKFAIATTTGALLQRVFVREIIASQIAPESAPTTEPSANAAWPFYRPGRHDATAGLVDGSASTALGWVRLIDQCEQGRTKWRTWRQWTFPELDAYVPQTTSAVVGNLTWPQGGAHTPEWYTRSRRLRGTTAGTAVAENAAVLARYKCGGTGGKIRVIVDGVANDYTVAAAGSYTTQSLGAITLPTGGTDQRVKIEVQGGVTTTGTLYVPTIAIVTNET